MTVEGERDDISGSARPRRTWALHEHLAQGRMRQHVQPGVGHYGVFSGKRWEAEIYPVFRDLVRASARIGSYCGACSIAWGRSIRLQQIHAIPSPRLDAGRGYRGARRLQETAKT